MKNQYLEKIASHQEEVKSILYEYNRRHNEIEDPINKMHKSMDDLEYAAMDNTRSSYHSDIIDKVRNLQEDNLRNSLDTFNAHKTNKYNTAVKLLDLGGLPAHEGSFDPDHVIRTFQNVHRQRNGQIGLVALGSVAGGIGGAILGARSMGGLGALVGGVAGAAGAAGLGSFALGSRIAKRDTEITQEHDRDLDTAFNYMKNHVSKG
jgi:hypothetical protein